MANRHTEEAVPTTAVPLATTPPLEEIFRRHAHDVYRTLQWLGVRPSELDDVFQEVFLVVHRRLHTYDPDASLRSWLFGIATRVAKSHRRLARFRREVQSETLPEPDPDPGVDDDPEAEAARAQARGQLEQMLDKLGPERRAVLVMFEIEGMTGEEIAELLGVPVGTVYSRLHAARKQFETLASRARARGGRR